MSYPKFLGLAYHCDILSSGEERGGIVICPETG